MIKSYSECNFSMMEYEYEYEYQSTAPSLC